MITSSSMSIIAWQIQFCFHGMKFSREEIYGKMGCFKSRIGLAFITTSPLMYFHNAAVGFWGPRIVSKPGIPMPFPSPNGDNTVLIGDSYKTNHSMESHSRWTSNPQGSYYYDRVMPSRTIKLASASPMIGGKQRYALTEVSFNDPDTPVKLSDLFKVQGVFSLGSVCDGPRGGSGYLKISVMAADFRAFMEIVFHIDFLPRNFQGLNLVHGL